MQLQSIGASSRPLAPERFPDVVKPAKQVLRILLVASDTCHESDLVVAMFMELAFRGGTRFSSLVNFNLVLVVDVLVVVNILDRLRADYLWRWFLVPALWREPERSGGAWFLPTRQTVHDCCSWLGLVR